jgi:hypothetical protein
MNLQPTSSHYTMMEAGSFHQLSVHIDQTTGRYIPEGCNLHIHCHDNFNPLISLHQIDSWTQPAFYPMENKGFFPRGYRDLVTETDCSHPPIPKDMNV